MANIIGDVIFEDMLPRQATKKIAEINTTRVYKTKIHNHTIFFVYSGESPILHNGVYVTLTPTVKELTKEILRLIFEGKEERHIKDYLSGVPQNVNTILNRLEKMKLHPIFMTYIIGSNMYFTIGTIKGSVPHIIKILKKSTDTKNDVSAIINITAQLQSSTTIKLNTTKVKNGYFLLSSIQAMINSDGADEVYNSVVWTLGSSGEILLFTPYFNAIDEFSRKVASVIEQKFNAIMLGSTLIAKMSGKDNFKYSLKKLIKG